MASEILDDLRWRGLLALTTDEAALDRALSAGPVTFYCGFDPTAPSLHFGNLVQLVTMRRLQEAGSIRSVSSLTRSNIASAIHGGVNTFPWSATRFVT